MSKRIITDKYEINASPEFIGVEQTPNLTPDAHHIFYAWYFKDYKDQRCKIGETTAVVGLPAIESVAHCFDGYSSRPLFDKMICNDIFIVPRTHEGAKWHDKKFHRFLLNRGINRTNKMQNNEFFEIPHYDVAPNLRRAITKQGKKEIHLNTVQKETIDEVMEHLRDPSVNNYHIIADLCARFGKTLWILELAKRCRDEFGHRIAILPSYWLSTHFSVVKEINEFANFNGMRFIDTKETDQKDWVAEIDECFNLGIFPVVGISLCGDEEAEKFEPLSYIPSHLKFIFIDEADFGTHTEKSRKIIDKIT